MAAHILASRLFRNDASLKRCLFDDAAHILTGACGPHVSKIQLSLWILDNADIPAADMRARRYGAATAAAVLQFKQKRDIINYSYQTQADDIVGKMTIATMDQEMQAWERAQSSQRNYYCPDCAQADASDSTVTASFQLTGGPPAPAPAPIVLAGSLDLLWQPSSGAGNQANKMLKYLIRAINLLRPFGLGLMSSTVSPPDAPFPFDPPVDLDNSADCWLAFKAAEKMRPAGAGVLRVLVCPAPPAPDPDRPIYAVTKSGGRLRGNPVPPFIILNASVFRTDECTLLHEMIHAANLKLTDKEHDPDSSSVFAVGNARNVLKPQHAAEFNSAFFRK